LNLGPLEYKTGDIITELQWSASNFIWHETMQILFCWILTFIIMSGTGKGSFIWNAWDSGFSGEGFFPCQKCHFCHTGTSLAHFDLDALEILLCSL
jgi:hypothetical protein